MFVQTSPPNKDGRVLMYFARSYRENGKPKQETVERIGFIDEFTHLYEDPITHFKQVAKIRTKELQEKNKPITLELAPDALLPFNPDTLSYDCVKNIGYAAVSSVFHSLGIHKFFDDRRKYLKVSYNLTSVVKLLVYERIIAPGSKRAAWEGRNKYFDKMDFDLHAVYRSLSILPKYRDALLKQLHLRMVDVYHRNTTLMFYDVTNYYFEIDNEDSFRRKGASKEHRKTPIVQMGLFMDDQGFPVSYDLFPGNTHDSQTFIPLSKQTRELMEADHYIYVADKGMMCGDNAAEAITNHNGYIFSKSVRGGTKVLKNTVRDQSGYLKFDEHGQLIREGDSDTPISFMYKVLDEMKAAYVINEEGKRVSVRGAGHYQIVYWSAKYASRAKLDRQAAVEKALAASHSNSKEVVDNNHGRGRYLKTQITDKKTKQKLDAYDAQVVFDFAALDEDESFDGYYVIETNVTGLRPYVDTKGHETEELEPEFGRKSRWLEKEGRLQLNRIVEPLDIVDMYRGLWKIEQTFRVTKSELNTRPVYVSQKDRTDAHFLTCFLSLLIVKILEHALNHEFSTEVIISSMKKANVVELNSTTFKTLYYDKPLQKLKETLGVEFGMNLYTRAGIRKMLAATKKKG